MRSTENSDHAIAGIVIPAHDEERTILRLLDALHGTDQQHFEVVVVCNGCTDDTARIARSAQVQPRVIEIEQPSKKVALRVGDDLLTTYPRVFIDADVEITAADVALLVAPLAAGTALATAPNRVLPRDGVALAVRWYYDVWECLPQVRSGLFGRGVVALSADGNDRVRALPPAMSDDLVMSEAFSSTERLVVDEATVIVRPPRTVRDLIRRRVRVATGNTEADRAGLRGDSSRTSIRTLLSMVRSEPRLAVRMPVFLALTVFSRIAAKRAIRAGDFTTWKRDESSRA